MENQKEQQILVLPRAVSVESMLNEIYDNMQEIKAALNQILKDMKDKK